MSGLSIIIPFYDPIDILKDFLPKIIGQLSNDRACEIILVDANKTDEVAWICSHFNLIYLESDIKNRAAQMNLGASNAKFDRLFFLHIDSIPPKNFNLLIEKTLEKGINSGCFQLAFDWDHWWLKFFAYFTRFRWKIARGGDQGLFITKNTFQDLGGFRQMELMEDVDMCRRLLNSSLFEVLPEKLITSARKYRQVGIYKLQLIFIWISLNYWLGASEEKLSKIYRKNIRPV